MSQFRLRDTCQGLLTELRTYFGDRNIIKLEVDQKLPDLFADSGTALPDALRTLVQFLAGNIVNGIIEVNLAQSAATAADVTITVKAIGSGTPGANITKLEKSEQQLKDEFKTAAPQFPFQVSIGSANNKISLQFEVSLKTTVTPKPKVKQTFPGKRFLLAEDNEVNVIVFSSFLDDWGATYTVVANGEEAVEAVKASEFDAVLMDIHMPVMDGTEAIRLIRRFNPDIPIIVLSAASHTEDIEMAMNMGGTAFLKKPVSSWELYSVLVKHLH